MLGKFYHVLVHACTNMSMCSLFNKEMVNIFAGGVGQRLCSGENSIPKQFLKINDKPIIIHTLELFQKHNLVDKIYISIHPDYYNYMEELVRYHYLDKVCGIVKGGTTGQDSIYNALLMARAENPDDSIVLIHDGVRPNITKEVITKCIECAKEKGNAITCTSCFETILISEDGIKIKLPRIKMNKKMYQNTPIQPNKIIFNHFGGIGYGCNPKYIAEEIIKRKLPYELVWICKNKEIINSIELPAGMQKTIYGTGDCLKQLSAAKIIISNVHLNKLISLGWEKKEGQKYIQTWHGALGIKKIDNSVNNDNNKFFNKNWVTLAQQDTLATDYMISNSTFEDDVYREGLSWDKQIFKFGHARNDVFFYDDEQKQQIRKKVCEKLNIPENKKILLYAPSYRDDASLDCYNINFAELKTKLSQKFGADWQIIIRLHPNIAQKDLITALFYPFTDFINATQYSDIQELLIATDIGITDYSSWMFDFMLSKKPMLIYADDSEKYNTERGFYYPLEETPFPVAKNNSELLNNIEKFDIENFGTFLWNGKEILEYAIAHPEINWVFLHG